MTSEVLQKIVKQTESEPYPCEMGMVIEKVEPGYSRVSMKCTKEMRNLFGMTHGGATFSLIDEAFELACNSHGTVAVALSMSITFFAPALTDTIIRAEAREVNLTRKTGTYQIIVTDSEDRKLALCQALAYRKNEPLPFLEKE